MLTFAFSDTFDPATDIPNLEGKVAIVTGATYGPFVYRWNQVAHVDVHRAGIGLPTAQHLANHGARVYLAVRDVAKGNATIKRFEDENPALVGKNQLRVLHLDLNSVAKTKAAAQQFLELEDRLDILGRSLIPPAATIINSTYLHSEQRWSVSQCGAAFHK